MLRLRNKTKPGSPRPDGDAEAAPVRALSDSTIRQTYTVLRAGLGPAVRDGLLARNPAAQVRRPGVERTEARHLDADAVTAVLRAEEPSRYHPALVSMLRKRKAGQAAERLHAANQWQDSRLVFTIELGRPVDPRNLLRVIEAAAKTAGIEGVGVHTLRHSAAVSWLESGVHIKAVADLLGHSSIAITGDVYGHTSDDSARAAVDGLAERLGL